MLARYWKWLLLALCSTAGIACNHPRGAAPARCCQVAGLRCGKAVNDVCRLGPPGAAVFPHAAAKRDSGPILPPGYAPSPFHPNRPGQVIEIPTGSPRPLDASVGKPETFTVTVPPVEAPSPIKPIAEAPVIIEPEAVRPVPAKPVAEKTPVATKTPPAALPRELSRELKGTPTRAARYEHAPDFSYVVGELQYIESRRQWRLRYAPHDADDTYGGVVTLRGAEHLVGEFKPGQTVRILGQLVDPDAKRPAPEYQAYHLQKPD